MFDTDQVLNGLLIRRKGLLVRREAIDDGVAEWLIDDRARAGVLIAVHDGVLRHAAVPVTTDQRWLAAVLAAGSDALLFGRAAAALHGWPGVRRVKPEVVSPHTDLPLLHGVDVHRAVRLRPFEQTVVRGIPVTSRGRTALAYAWLAPFGKAQEVIAQAVIAKLLTPLDIVTTLERSCGRGVPGTAALRAIGLSLDELEGLDSVLELDGYRAIELARVPTPVKQLELTCADGREVRMDLAWPQFKVGLDWDSKRWHGSPAQKRRTKERHLAIEATDGWRHLAYGHTDVHDTPDEMRAEVESEVATRRERRAA
jgi:hypothetical protein